MLTEALIGDDNSLAHFETYHIAWLSVHPERTPAWLKDRFADGFHVHHIDGNHSNDDPLNLVLIEGGDHMMLHNGSKRLLWRPPSGKKSPGRPKKVASAPEVACSVSLDPPRATAVTSGKNASRAEVIARKEAKARLYEAAAARLRFLDAAKTAKR